MRTLPTAAAALALSALASPSLAGERAYGKTRGVVPGILVGPRLNVVALPPGAGLEVRLLDNALGLSFDVGVVPTTTIDQASVSWTDVGAGVKVFPWRARFYLGARAGRRSFAASAKDATTGITLEAKADVTSVYLAPEAGWRFVWESGLFLGLELGYQIVVSRRATFDIPAAIDPTTEQDVRDAADHIGKIGLPILTLLQVGWYF